MRKNYQYILLDWDGNLAKTLEVWVVAYSTVLAELGYKLDNGEISSHVFGAPREYLKNLGVQDIQAAMDEINLFVKIRMPEIELYPNTLIVLESMRASGKNIALITSTRRDNLTHALEKFSLKQYFDIIITAEDVTHPKPHPEPLDKALTAMKGHKEKAVVIGDSISDLESAKRAGIDSILFYPPEHHKFYDLEVLKQLKPTYVVDDFLKVLAIVTDLPD